MVVYSFVVGWGLIIEQIDEVHHFLVPKSGEEESKLLKGSVPKSTVYNNKMNGLQKFYENSK